jgi:two-component system sensor histidine kinase KdpD
LPPDQISAVFQKFYRLPHSKPGGTGLGLSIARGFVEAHQGTIVFENISPTGARVTITIPAEMTSMRAQED